MAKTNATQTRDTMMQWCLSSIAKDLDSAIHEALIRSTHGAGLEAGNSVHRTVTVVCTQMDKISAQRTMASAIPIVT